MRSSARHRGLGNRVQSIIKIAADRGEDRPETAIRSNGRWREIRVLAIPCHPFRPQESVESVLNVGGKFDSWNFNLGEARVWESFLSIKLSAS